MPGLYSHTTRVTGTVLTAAIYNADHQNHIDNQTPQMTDDYSSNAAEMQSTRDPYPGAVISLATDLSKEIEGLRYLIAQITGETYWYIDPDTNIASINTALSSQLATDQIILLTAYLQ